MAFSKTFSIILLVGLIACSVAEIAEQETAPTENEKIVRMESRVNGDEPGRAKLRKELFANYDKENIPDNVKILFGVESIDVHAVKDAGLFKTNVWLQMFWTDSRLAWDNQTYGLDSLSVGAHEVWKPDIFLYNNAEPKETNCRESNVVLRSTGQVIWVPPCNFMSYCNFTTTVEEESKSSEATTETYHCVQQYGSWTYDKSMIDLTPMTQGVGVSYYQGTHWQITSSKVQQIDKEYDCCPGQIYTSLKYFYDITKM